MVFDLLGDGDVVGAIGIDTREDRMVVFKAKTVVIGTGRCARLYPSPTPGWMFNVENPPSNTGDGRAMAYRAGVELAELELPSRHSGPKYICHGGKGTWIGVLRDPQGKPVGPFITKPERKYGDPTVDIYTAIFEDYAKSGRGPVYMDCTDISDEDYEYMMHWLKHESNNTLIFQAEGIDVRKHPFEFHTYEMRLRGGIYFNEKGETSLKGLYAAGDVGFPTGVSGAATFGWIAGENAARYAEGLKSPEIERSTAQVKEKVDLVDKIRNREEGAEWKEFNVALQQIMYDYAGSVRSETLLRAGLSYLRRLRQRADSLMIAANQHELMHCLEVLDLLELGELLFIMADERKETRGRHVRPDYPFANPLIGNKLHIVKKVDGKPVTEWRDVGKYGA
jgi:succinate dehydrogenase/fumarate reductase flavoprotein subunit